MRVRVIKISNVKNHVGNDKHMMKCFSTFFEKIQFVNWEIPQNIMETFKSSDLITCSKGQLNRVVFNICRNRYRMICGYHFGGSEVILFIKFVGTHQEYDKVDVCTINMFKK